MSPSQIRGFSNINPRVLHLLFIQEILHGLQLGKVLKDEPQLNINNIKTYFFLSDLANMNTFQEAYSEPFQAFKYLKWSVSQKKLKAKRR